MGVALRFKTAVLLLLGGEETHDTDSRKGLGCYGRKPRQLLLDVVADDPEAPGGHIQYEGGQRKDQEGQEGEFPVYIQQEGDHPGKTQPLDDYVYEYRGYHVLQDGDIVRYPGEHLPYTPAVKVAEGHPLHVIVKPKPQVDHDPLPHPVHQVLLTVKEDAFGEVKEHQPHRDEVQHGHVLAYQDIVHDVPEEPGRDDRAGR